MAMISRAKTVKYKSNHNKLELIDALRAERGKLFWYYGRNYLPQPICVKFDKNTILQDTLKPKFYIFTGVLR